MAKRPAHPESPASTHVSRHLISVSSAVRIFARRELESRGHQPSAAISLIVTNLPPDGLGMSALARRAGLSLQRAGQLVGELEDAGYVERIADPNDGRARRAVYTARGQHLLDDIEAINDAVTAKLIDQLGQDRFWRLLGDLSELDTALGNKDGLRIVLG
jgi:DNA-binding MarR family transcriptional regulator